jgi:hypothetical protein
MGTAGKEARKVAEPIFSATVLWEIFTPHAALVSERPALIFARHEKPHREDQTHH